MVRPPVYCRAVPRAMGHGLDEPRPEPALPMGKALPLPSPVQAPEVYGPQPAQLSAPLRPPARRARSAARAISSAVEAELEDVAQRRGKRKHQQQETEPEAQGTQADAAQQPGRDRTKGQKRHQVQRVVAMAHMPVEQAAAIDPKEMPAKPGRTAGSAATMGSSSSSSSALPSTVAQVLEQCKSHCKPTRRLPTKCERAALSRDPTCASSYCSNFVAKLQESASQDLVALQTALDHSVDNCWTAPVPA